MTRLLWIPGLAAIADRFDTFVLDQFGVLHDGQKPYPGVLDCLAELRRAGKRVVILSNSGKRSEPNLRRLGALGFPRGCCDLFVSSGEVAYRMLADEAWHLPRKCLLIARNGDTSALDGLALEQTAEAQEADLVLIAASEAERFDLDHYRALLEAAARRGVQALCTNPDQVMLTASGPAFGAGRIADLYAEMGGPVRRLGKPYPEIYQAVWQALGDADRTRAVCVGDSIEHDVAGARSAGLASVLVLGGILKGLDDAGIEAECRVHEAFPDWVVGRFAWTQR